MELSELFCVTTDYLMKDGPPKGQTAPPPGVPPAREPGRILFTALLKQLKEKGRHTAS